MKKYFYVVEWPNGRKDSALVEASNANDAFSQAEQHANDLTQPTYYGGGITQVPGTVVAFNKVED